MRTKPPGLARTLALLGAVLTMGCGDAPAKRSPNNVPTNSSANNVTLNAATNAVANNNTRPTEPYEITDLEEGCDGNQNLRGAVLIEAARGETLGELSWTEGGSASVVVTVTMPETQVFLCTPGWDPPANSGAASSPATLAVGGATLHLETDDARLNDDFVGTATLDEFAGDGLVTISADVSIAVLTGEWRPDGETLHAQAVHSTQGGSSGVVGVSDEPVGSVTGYRTIGSWLP